MAFEERSPGPSHWGPALPGARLILPRRAWLRDGNQGWIIDTVPVSANDHVATIADRLSSDLPPDIGPAPIPTKPWDELASPAFMDLVQDAVALLRHGTLRKVVLARAVDSDLGHAPDMARSWAVCAAKVMSTRACTPPILTTAQSSVEQRLSCSSPRMAKRLRPWPLAGSRAFERQCRGPSAWPRNDVFGKERTEHQVVVDHIIHQLSQRCSELSIPERPRIRRLPLVQHLETRISGRLPDADPLDLVAACIRLPRYADSRLAPQATGSNAANTCTVGCILACLAGSRLVIPVSSLPYVAALCVVTKLACLQVRGSLKPHSQSESLKKPNSSSARCARRSNWGEYIAST